MSTLTFSLGIVTIFVTALALIMWVSTWGTEQEEQ